MEKRYQFYGIDVMKFVCACLVIMIHTAPFAEMVPEFNFYLVQVVARIAVPFFFVASGFLFFMKLDRTKHWRDAENFDILMRYLKRIGFLYVIWSGVYLLFTLFGWFKSGFQMVMLIRYIRDFLLTGSSYHLWFLPSLMVGVTISYFLFLKVSYKKMLTVVSVLYTVGMVLNVYGDVLQSIPGISMIYDVYISVFVTSRNGFFFAPIFILMGAYFALSQSILTKRDAFIGSIISFVLLCYEALMLRKFHYMHDVTSMYLFLVPLEFFLFSFVAQWIPSKKPAAYFLRVSSLLIYVSHIVFVYIMTVIWQLVLKQAIPNIWLYVSVTICSLLFSFFCIYASKTKLKWLKVFY